MADVIEKMFILFNFNLVTSILYLVTVILGTTILEPIL